MIHITEDALHITLPHPCPEEALQDLQNEIIEALQNQYEHFKNIGIPPQEDNNTNYMLLELLKATLTQQQPREIEIRYLDEQQAKQIAETLQNLIEILLSDPEP